MTPTTPSQAVEAAEREKVLFAQIDYVVDLVRSDGLGWKTGRAIERLKLILRAELSRPQEVAAPVGDYHQRWLDTLQDVLDAKEIMRAAGIGQCDFPTMFKEFAASRMREFLATQPPKPQDAAPAVAIEAMDGEIMNRVFSYGVLCWNHHTDAAKFLAREIYAMLATPAAEQGDAKDARLEYCYKKAMVVLLKPYMTKQEWLDAIDASILASGKAGPAAGEGR